MPLRLLAVTACLALAPSGAMAQNPDLAEEVAEARALFNAGDHDAAVAMARPLAEAGERGAINLLGVAHVTGRGAEKDVELGLRLMNEAADAGFDRALLSLGLFHAQGLFGVPQDTGLARNYFARAAALGSDEGRVRLAELILAQPEVSPADRHEAGAIFEEAAANGYGPGQATLAAYIASGELLGRVANPARARALYLDAAKGGVPGAWGRLGFLYETGSGGAADLDAAVTAYLQGIMAGNAASGASLARLAATVPALDARPEQVAAWCHWAVTKGADVNCARLLDYMGADAGILDKAGALRADPGFPAFGRAATVLPVPAEMPGTRLISTDALAARELFRAGDAAGAMALAVPAAEAGDAMAQNLVGVAMETGEGIAADPARSVALREEAAAQGYPSAMSNLAVILGDGLFGVTPDPDRAIALAEAAARQGNAGAGNALGFWLQYGVGDIPADPARAADVYRRAALLGDATAANNLAWMLKEGTAVRRNLPYARDLFAEAMARGEWRAFKGFGEMAEFGEGGPRDLPAAVRAYQGGVARGDELAGQYLALLVHENPGAGFDRLWIVAYCDWSLVQPGALPEDREVCERIWGLEAFTEAEMAAGRQLVADPDWPNLPF